jgi:hypothetical protein
MRARQVLGDNVLISMLPDWRCTASRFSRTRRAAPWRRWLAPIWLAPIKGRLACVTKIEFSFLNVKLLVAAAYPTI